MRSPSLHSPSLPASLLKATAVLGVTALSAGFSPSAHAATSITVFTDQTLFEGAFTNLATGSYLNDFVATGVGQQTNYTGSGNGFSYIATQSATNGSDPRFTYRPSANTVLQAYNNGQSLIFTATGGSYNAIGGNFFLSDIRGNFYSGPVTVTVSNGTDTATQTYNPISATAGSFRGFVSTLPITTLTVTGATSNNENLNTTDSLRVGTVAVPSIAPEPGSLALLLSVIGTLSTVGIAVKKRNRRTT